jgi:rhodanese-related sulfurtransferase
MSTFVLRHRELPQDRPILMICQTGARSGQTTAFLIANGWMDVVNVAGGTLAWERAGLPVRRGALAPGEGDLPG